MWRPTAQGEEDRIHWTARGKLSGTNNPQEKRQRGKRPPHYNGRRRDVLNPITGAPTWHVELIGQRNARILDPTGGSPHSTRRTRERVHTGGTSEHKLTCLNPAGPHNETTQPTPAVTAGRKGRLFEHRNF